jgi:hypothetical protein
MLDYRNQLFHDIDASILPRIDKLELKINVIINVLNGYPTVYKVAYDEAIKQLREWESEYINKEKRNG